MKSLYKSDYKSHYISVLLLVLSVSVATLSFPPLLPFLHRLLPSASVIFWLVPLILIFAIIRGKGEFVFFTLLLIYGLACLKNLIPSSQLIWVFPILITAAIARNDTPISKFSFIGFILIIYVLPRAYISGWGFIYKFEWLYLIAYIASATIAVVLVLNLNSDKYLKVNFEGEDTKLEVYTNTFGYAPAVIFMMPFHIFVMRSAEEFSFLIPSIYFLLNLFVIGISIAAIWANLLQHKDRSKIILHSSGKISSPEIVNAQGVRISEKQYNIADVTLEHSPEALEKYAAKFRKGDVYLAGGSGPEGAALFATSATMTAADGISKLASGFGELVGIGLRNYQKRKSGWQVVIHVNAEGGDSVLILTNVREQVAKRVKKLLLEQRCRSGTPS